MQQFRQNSPSETKLHVANLYLSYVSSKRQELVRREGVREKDGGERRGMVCERRMVEREEGGEGGDEMD